MKPQDGVAVWLGSTAEMFADTKDRERTKVTIAYTHNRQQLKKLLIPVLLLSRTLSMLPISLLLTLRVELDTPFFDPSTENLTFVDPSSSSKSL